MVFTRGKLEWGESIEAGAVREAKEETGIDYPGSAGYFCTQL